MLGDDHQLALAFALLTLAAPARAEPVEAAPAAVSPAERPSVGLVLSGGGALGLAHIGVLKATEELRIPVDLIAGTSIGGLVGGLYASGMSAAEIERAALEIDWAATFEDAPPRRQRSMRRKEDDLRFVSDLTVGVRGGQLVLPSGLIQGHRQDLLFARLTLPVATVRDFDALPIPFACVAADLQRREEVLLREGELAAAMRATMAIPGMFAPVAVGDRLLVDGGVMDNLPIDDARDMGAEVVLASWTSLPAGGDDLLGASSASMFALIDAASRRQAATLGADDALVWIEQPPSGRPDWERAEALIAWGYESAMAQLGGREDLQVSEAEWAAWRSAVQRPAWTPPTIDAMGFVNQSGYGYPVLLRGTSQNLGQPLDVDRLEADLDRLYGLGAFDRLSYSLVEQGEQTELRAHAAERSLGPDYLSVGLEADVALSGDNDIVLTLAHRRYPWNQLGGEWRSEARVGTELGLRTELYQPLAPGLRTFGALLAEASRTSLTSYQDLPLDVEELREALADLGLEPEQVGFDLPDEVDNESLEVAIVEQITQGEVGADLGWAPTQSLELRAGYHVSWLQRESNTVELFPDIELLNAQAELRLLHDRLDNAWFPRRGTYAEGELGLARWARGGDEATDTHAGTEEVLAFSTAAAEALVAGSLRRHTLLAYGEVAVLDAAGSSTLSTGYRLGGPFRLSGFRRDVLAGDELAFALVGYRTRLLDGPVPLHLGANAEAGQIGEGGEEDRIYAGSAYLGAETPIGPAWLVYGSNTWGYRQAAFLLGRAL